MVRIADDIIPGIKEKRPLAVIMNTFKINHLARQDRIWLLAQLNPDYSAVLYEDNSDTCYFVIATDESEMFTAAVSGLNNSFEKESISAIRERYLTNSNYFISGNCDLLSFCLIAKKRIITFDRLHQHARFEKLQNRFVFAIAAFVDFVTTSVQKYF
jgi:hypothetical protein